MIFKAFNNIIYYCDNYKSNLPYSNRIKKAVALTNLFKSKLKIILNLK